jgi:hypothetical protein
MDELIALIKARVADPLRAVDAAAWVRPIPTVAPPAMVAEEERLDAWLAGSTDEQESA